VGALEILVSIIGIEALESTGAPGIPSGLLPALGLVPPAEPVLPLNPPVVPPPIEPDIPPPVVPPPIEPDIPPNIPACNRRRPAELPL